MEGKARGLEQANATSAGDAAVTVVLPRALLRLFPDAPSEVSLEARTVGEMIAELDVRWPGMRDRLQDSTPAVRRHINVFVDGRRGKLETPLREGLKVYVLTAISGG
ncbi:MoaD/ThiS family protein [Hyphomicrobium sp.]|uniref:MoaD/ThiS family protein n=1 Tax=Hyphomicrobium sp. TaxID=82 RepID=UPI002C68920E|nr:MoaD/ThiS family protein [Hyphomicrobium sp.]HRN89349.1 MoaD/ThiS family protein [Hyphomicrobium sp.]HRQ28043.1 MoaD/ThiS family protein [Hyphomicrobium sp.]